MNNQEQIPDWMLPIFERTEHPFYVWEELMKTTECMRLVLTDQGLSSISTIANSIIGTKMVHMLGCGSSYFSAIAGAYVFNGVAGLPAFAYNAFEFSAYPPANLSESTVIGISHTGGTAVVLDSITLSEKQGAISIGITDVDHSPLAHSASHVIKGGGGREKPLPKTRSFTVSLLKHFLLAVEIGLKRGQNLKEMKAHLLESPEVAQQILDENQSLSREIASSLCVNSKIYLFGAGPNTACVMDGALKLQEMVQANAYAFELEEGMHGPWVTMEPEDLLVVYAIRGPSFEKAKGFISAIAAVGAKIWVLTDDPKGIPGVNYTTYLPNVPELISPLYSMLPVYEFVYHLALAREIKPDSMRLTDDRYREARLNLPR